MNIGKNKECRQRLKWHKMTKRRMYLRMILSSLVRRRSRMVIALMAIAIGATIMSGMVMIYYDIPRQLGKEFRSYGANFMVLPSGDEKISEETLAQVRSSLPADLLVGLAPYRYETTKINQKPYILAGTDLEQARKNSPFWYIEGEWTKDDPDGVMVGKEIARTIGLQVGDRFRVEGIKYGRQAVGSTHTDSAEQSKVKNAIEDYYAKDLTVKGIVTTGGAEEGFIFLDLKVLDQMLEDQTQIDGIECSIEGDAESLQSLADRLKSDVPEVVGRPVRRVTQSQDRVLGKLQALVFLVDVVVLLLTMISVLTTMMAVVTERRKEIGLKKALGAPDRDIVREFLGEGSGLGLLGGALGVLFGWFFAQRVSLTVFGRAIEFSWWLAPATVLLAILVTVAASLWPVKQAVKVDPALVLRGE